ncbi:MAG: DUF4019 domain-containing protein [Pseudomonadales bacterium]|nr:DUF4019 domain-containing protein [Pseudomonadales bacterium]
MKTVELILLMLFSTSLLVQPIEQENDPHPRQDEAIEIANEWLDLLEENDVANSFDLYTDLYKSMTTTITWEQELETERTTLGKLVSRELRRAVMYENPENAPLPGTYAAVEFDSVYEHARRHSQTIILHSENSEPFRVMRREVRQLLNRSSPASDGAN